MTSIAFFPILLGAIVKDDLMRLFHNFHGHWMFKTSLNATFIALIPKKTEQLEVRDFKSILTRWGSVYKIMAKVIAIRLK